MFNELINKIADNSPAAVMAIGILKNVLSAEKIDLIFQNYRRTQRKSPWLFSCIVPLMTIVVCKIRPAVHAAYKAVNGTTPGKLSALYGKINGVETQVSEALLRETAQDIREAMTVILPQQDEIIPGYRNKIVDGNKLPATERRLEVARNQEAVPLPGFALVVYEPACRLITNALLCEDGHAQERTLFPRLVSSVEPNDLWFADRNFCCWNFTHGIAKRGGYFIVRHHLGSVRWIPETELEYKETSATGDVWEQCGVIENTETGERIAVRRIEVRLKEPTRDGDTLLGLFSNLPASVSALVIADSYHGRWRIETAFAELAAMLHGEIDTLCYPEAALFALSCSYVAYNIMQCLVSSIETSHPEAKGPVSAYHVAHEVSSSYYGLSISTEDSDWEEFTQASPMELGRMLLELGAKVNYSRFSKRPPPKKPPTRKPTVRKNHTSTAKLLKNHDKSD